MNRLRLRLAALLASIVAGQHNSFADEPVVAIAPNAVAPHSDSPPAPPSDEAIATLQWAVYLIQSNLPPRYEGQKHWGETKRLYTGIEIDHDGLRLKTHRRYREVNHGKWLRYTIDLKDPNHPQNLNIQVIRAETASDGRLRLELLIDTKVDIEARQERWNLGMKLISVSTNATAKLRMSLTASIGFAFDYTRIPPDVLFDPKVEAADIQLVDLEVDRISKLGSDIAEELGDIAERVIREEYLPKQREKLPQKLNAQIDRRRDKLRISASDWLTKRLSTPAPKNN